MSKKTGKWRTAIFTTDSDCHVIVFAHIKLKAGIDKREAISHIQSTLAGFDPYFTFNISFMMK